MGLRGGDAGLGKRNWVPYAVLAPDELGMGALPTLACDSMELGAPRKVDR